MRLCWECTCHSNTKASKHRPTGYNKQKDIKRRRIRRKEKRRKKKQKIKEERIREIQYFACTMHIWEQKSWTMQRKFIRLLSILSDLISNHHFQFCSVSIAHFVNEWSEWEKELAEKWMKRILRERKEKELERREEREREQCKYNNRNDDNHNNQRKLNIVIVHFRFTFTFYSIETIIGPS